MELTLDGAIEWLSFGAVVRILVASVVGVGVAFSQCAVAEAAVVLGGVLYTGDREKRAVRVEEWRRVIQDMTPRERPAFAGSLLFSGARRRLSGEASREARKPAARRGPSYVPYHLRGHVHENPRKAARRALWSSVAAVLAVVGPVTIASITDDANVGGVVESPSIGPRLLRGDGDAVLATLDEVADAVAPPTTEESSEGQ